MLERVPVLEKHVDDYAGIVGIDVIDRIRELAAPLQGARVLHVNATAYGGGVAELLATHVPLLRSVGVDADWQVMHGSDEFFGVTKEVHNALQGADIEWTTEMQRTYLEKVLDNALLLDGHYDFVVIHDPQPAAMLSFLRERLGGAMADTKWIWRCHIDLTDANPKVWEFFRPFVEIHDASVWTMPEFVPASLDMDRVVHAPPCIDPLSVKNLDLAPPFCNELMRQYGVDVHRPIVCQVSRFDPWKDPVGVIDAFRIVREQVQDAQLVLAGSMATDDPEGFRVWDETETARAGDKDIYLLSNLHQVGAVQINAFQRAADVIVQKSLREGFGLTVSEGLWKGRPVVGGRAGGITLQIRDGFDGYLVDSIEQCAARIVDLLADPVAADALGAQGREHVRDNFLSTRELDNWLSLFGELRGMMLVTHRGPFQFSVRDDGRFEATRGAGGVVSALLPLIDAGIATGDARGDERVAWIAATMDDGDAAALAAGATTVPGLDLHLLGLDPTLHRLHYDIVSNATLWFLHHGLFDLPRRPQFDEHFRSAWDAYVAVNAAFADAIVDTAATGETVMVHDYQLALVPGIVRAARPDLALLHFTHTPFCGPNSIRVLPTDIAVDLCRSMSLVPSGFHTTRWAAAYQASARTMLGIEAPITASFATPLGPDPDALADDSVRALTSGAVTELDDIVGDRKLIMRADRIDPSKNIVRGFLAYDQLLAQHKEWHERVVFVARLTPSRESLAEYLAYRQEVERAAMRVNDRWARGDWQPVVIDERDDYDRSVAGFRRYDVLFVNPVKDGLNLVAKEGPLVNERDGVLCLSPEAGAFDELGGAAVAVHPFDVSQSAAALQAALSMPASERAARAARLRELVIRHTPSSWLAELFTHAA